MRVFLDRQGLLKLAARYAMSDQNHGAASQQEQAAIAGVEQPDAERQAQAEAEGSELLPQGPARLLHAQREQVELLAVDLDSVLPADRRRGGAGGHRVIKLERVAHDGALVCANAGAASFRRREKLTKQLGMARASW